MHAAKRKLSLGWAKIISDSQLPRIVYRRVWLRTLTTQRGRPQKIPQVFLRIFYGHSGIALKAWIHQKTLALCALPRGWARSRNGISIRRIEQFFSRLIEIAHVVFGIWAFINFFGICVKILIPNQDDDTLCRAYRPFAWILFIASIIFFTWGPLADHRSSGEKAKAAQLDEESDLVGHTITAENESIYADQIASAREAHRVGHY